MKYFRVNTQNHPLGAIPIVEAVLFFVLIGWTGTTKSPVV
jgi:hypothetical protein